jgi:hypothetical protein
MLRYATQMIHQKVRSLYCFLYQLPEQRVVAVQWSVGGSGVGSTGPAYYKWSRSQNAGCFLAHADRCSSPCCSRRCRDLQTDHPAELSASWRWRRRCCCRSSAVRDHCAARWRRGLGSLLVARWPSAQAAGWRASAPPATPVANRGRGNHRANQTRAPCASIKQLKGGAIRAVRGCSHTDQCTARA